MPKSVRTIRSRLVGPNLVAFVGLIGILGVSLGLLGYLGVHGPLYERLALQKDLVADVLPPPMLMVEPMLLVNQICDADEHVDRVLTASRIQTLNNLKQQFNERAEHWSKATIGDSQRAALLEQSVPPAREFWSIVDEQLLPLILAGNFDAARATTAKHLDAVYLRHREAVDLVIRATAAQIAATEQAAETDIALMRAGMIVWICVIGLIIVLSSRKASRQVAGQVSRLIDWIQSHRPGEHKRIEFAGDYELNVLAKAFSRMSSSVYHNERRLQATIRALRENKSQLQQQARTLAAALEDARKLARVKSEFLTNMSHELRTPLNSILGFANLIAAGDQDPRHIQCVRSNGSHLLALINDVLDLSRLEADKVELEAADHDPAAVCSEVMAMFEPHARQKKLAFQFNIAPPLARTFRCDAMRVRQILANLIGNAIKFTEKGSVQLVVVFSSVAEPKLSFSVIDTGIGIAPESIGRLFNAFDQVDMSITRRFGGSGLGLAIAQRLADLMGGQITCESQLGLGSTFTFDLPLVAGEYSTTAPAVTTAPAALTVVPSLSGLRVLVIDDMPDNRRLLRFILEKSDAQVTEAADGQLGVVALSASIARGEPFDAVLMDMQMPVLDGYAATQAIRRFSQVPVVALTAHALTTDRDRCLAAGCDAYHTKPIDRGLLLRTLRELVDRPTARAA